MTKNGIREGDPTVQRIRTKIALVLFGKDEFEVSA
jgi:hypothetical protein